MKNNKGISMITLIITIIVMIILLSLAYRIGTRYISESKEEERNVLISIMSSAVEKRQKDNYVGLEDAKAYYAGYHLSSGDFDLLYPLLNSNDSVYSPGLWYMIDAISAEDLGVVDSGNYLVNDIGAGTDNKGKYIAVVDYYTGKVYLIEYRDIETIQSIDLAEITQGTEGTHNPDHEPVYTVATCTEPSVCQLCGYVFSQALGHNYGKGEGDKYPNGMIHATCTEDLKCIRCGYIAEKATGHHYDIGQLQYDSSGHYNPCINLDYNTDPPTECGAMGNFKKHILHYEAREGTEWKHRVYCEECQYGKEEEIIEACNIAVKQKDKEQHICYCTQCLKEQLEDHDDIRYKYVDKNRHIQYCATCNEELEYEEHMDVEAPYGWCDKCNGQLDTTKKPIITVTMIKAGTGLSEEEKYFAKYGDTIEITVTTDMLLSDIPTIRVQGKEIRKSDITTKDANTYVATVVTSNNYDFEDGILTVQIANAKTLWGVRGNTVSTTADGKYVDYDGTAPRYIWVP